MNPSAISSSMPATNGSVSKSQQSSDSTHDVPFNQILSNEVADRKAANNANTAKSSDANTTSKPAEASNKASAGTAEESKSKDPVNTSEADNSTTAEQLLMMAGQFPPTNPVPNAASAVSAETLLASNLATAADVTTAKNASDLTASTTEASKTLLPGVALAATQDELAQAGDIGSGKAEQKQADFRAGLNQIIGKGQEEATAKVQDNLIMSASAQAAADIKAANTKETHPDLNASLAPLQSALVNQTQAHSSQSTDKLTPQVGTPAWNQSVGQKVVWMIGNDQQSASLTLNPPDLGPLQVVLNVSSTQANASFYSAQPEVRQALEAALPRLREILADAGIQLGQANVSAGTPQQQNSYDQSQQASSLTNHAAAASPAPISGITNNTRVVREGLIDTFA